MPGGRVFGLKSTCAIVRIPFQNKISNVAEPKSSERVKRILGIGPDAGRWNGAEFALKSHLRNLYEPLRTSSGVFRYVVFGARRGSHSFGNDLLPGMSLLALRLASMDARAKAEVDLSGS